jgi:hypothetical protein
MASFQNMRMFDENAATPTACRQGVYLGIDRGPRVEWSERLHGAA